MNAAGWGSQATGMFHHWSVLASMVSGCGALTFCSMRSELPPLWKVSLPRPASLFSNVPTSSTYLIQTSQTPVSCATKLLTAHPTISHYIHLTFKLILESGSSNKPKTCGCPNPLSFQACKTH